MWETGRTGREHDAAENEGSGIGKIWVQSPASCVILDMLLKVNIEH